MPSLVLMLDTDERNPRIPPWVVAGALALVGIVGAVAIYVLGSRGLDRDREDIRAYGSAIVASIDRTEAALDVYGDASRAAALSALQELEASPDCGSEDMPGTVETLRLRCEDVRSQIGKLEGRPAQEGHLVRDIRASIEAVREEFEELLCLARVSC